MVPIHAQRRKGALHEPPAQSFADNPPTRHRGAMQDGSRGSQRSGDPGMAPSKKGRHPEGVPQKVRAPPTRPNLEARAFRQPTPAAQVSLLAALLISEVHGPNA